MSLPSVYSQVNGQLPEFFAKIQDGQAPATFTQQHLKDLGFASSNHRSFIPILKAIGFLSPDGTPTARYHAYRDKFQAARVLGAALKEAYSDLFVIKSHPKESDKALIEGKFKSVHNATDRPAELMCRTFFALLKMADIDQASSPEAYTQVTKQEIPDPTKSEERPTSRMPTAPGLHYNIQIHLPATKDVEVYNAIFKSLKEHLIG